MTKDLLRDAIIKKQDELIDLYSKYARIDEDDDPKDKYKDAKLCSELASLKAELNKPVAENTNPMSQMDNSPYEIVWNGVAYIRK